MSPRWYEVVLGCASVVAGCLAGSAGFLLAHRTGRRWGYVLALGAALFVAGVAGQRSFPTADQVHRLGQGATDAVPGPWDAGIGLPGLGVRITPVALIGSLLGAVAFGVLLARRAQTSPSLPAEPGSRREFEDDDSA